MSAFLAQFNILDSAVIPPLGSPPLIEHLLLENPWPIAGASLFFALILFLVFNARGKLKIGTVVSVLALALAGGVCLLARAVVTDREKIMANARDLVAAVATVDRPRLKDLLDQDLSVRVTKVTPEASRDEVIDRIESIIGKTYRVTDYRVLELQAEMFGPRVGRTQLRVSVSSEFGTLPSWWVVDWTMRTDQPWRATRIEALWIPGVPNPGG